jgi:hypothetical protein
VSRRLLFPALSCSFCNQTHHEATGSGEALEGIDGSFVCFTNKGVYGIMTFSFITFFGKNGAVDTSLVAG